jgi:hypothetical protein
LHAAAFAYIYWEYVGDTMRKTAKTKVESEKAKPRRARKKPAAPLPPIAATGIDAPAVGGRPEGRPTDYRPEFARIAKAMALLGGTDFEIAQELGVVTDTVWRWRSKHPEFSDALKEGKAAFDDRIERSLAMRAAGYSYHSEKIVSFEGAVVRVPIVEHVPPDVGAIKLWLNNRRPGEWRDKQEVALSGTDAFVAMWKAISENAIKAPAAVSG